MRRKKSSNRSPDIIVTFNFNTSSSVKSFRRFAEYTNREEATKIEQQAEQSFEEHFEAEDYKKMIAYMKRDTAVINADKKRTGLFNGHSQNMTIEQMDELKDNLVQAQRAGNNLWNGAVSFDIGFLIQIGVLEYNGALEAKIAAADQNKKRLEAKDKELIKNGQSAQHAKAIYLAKKDLENLAKQRKVDQSRLKEAIQEHMGAFLKAEGFHDDAFWWGSVHLNTKHIHVHVSISELHNSRKRTLNEATGEMEPRGKLKIRAIERFKSKLYHTLEIDDKGQQHRRLKEMEVGTQREAILSHLEPAKISKNSLLLEFYLREAQERLPEEGKLSFKSNRQEFKVCKAYLNAFIDTYLETVAKQDYENWEKATKEQLSLYEGAYSKEFDLEVLVNKRKQTLRDRLGNGLLKQLKENPLPVSKNEEPIDFLSANDLKKIVDDLKDSKLPPKELGTYKYLLKISQASDDEILFKKELSALSHFETLESNKDLKVSTQEKLKEKIHLVKLTQEPRFKLTSDERELSHKLQFKYTSARSFSIAKASSENIEQKIQFIDKELEILDQTRDKALIEEVYKKDKKKVLVQLQKEKDILRIKGKIYQNNQTNNKKANGPLFDELRQLYGEPKAKEVRPPKHSKAKMRHMFHTQLNQKWSARGMKQGSSSSKAMAKNYDVLSNIMANLNFKDHTSAKAIHAKKVSDQREERDR
jgi:hypothetical protein